MNEGGVWYPEQKFLLFRALWIFDVLLIACVLKVRFVDCCVRGS